MRSSLEKLLSATSMTARDLKLSFQVARTRPVMTVSLLILTQTCHWPSSLCSPLMIPITMSLVNASRAFEEEDIVEEL